MDDLPKKYLLEYITKKKKKDNPTWQDVNELCVAKDQMIGEIYESGDGEDYFDKALKRIKYDVEKIGLMVSFANPDLEGMLAIGYSLCNKKAQDKFDYQITRLGMNMGPVGYFEAPGFGFHIACGRAEDWGTRKVKRTKIYSVPESIKAQFIKFILRSQRYYKDKQTPEWIYNFLLNEGVIE